MSTTSLLTTFANAHSSRNGYLLASTLDPSQTDQLSAFVLSSTASTVLTDLRYGTVYNASLSLPRTEANAWLDIYDALWRAGRDILDAEHFSTEGKSADANWVGVYERWKEVANAVIAGYQKGGLEAWTIPCLYAVGRWTRVFAIRADGQVGRMGRGGDTMGGLNDDMVVEEGGMDKLEDAGRLISRIFNLCISDRAPLEDSRKWGSYYISNLLFRTYFKARFASSNLNQVNLCKNILRSLQASASDMPALTQFPKPHIITFQYYVGVISFLEEDYAKAEIHLTSALSLLPSPSSALSTTSPSITHNRSLLLTYLIPTRLMTSHVLPTPALLSPYPHLVILFTPLATCIKRGDLAGFDRALASGSAEFVKRRIYLTLERGRDVCLRNLFRKVFLAGGFEAGADGKEVRRTRVPVAEFVAGVRVGLRGRGGDAEGEGDGDVGGVEIEGAGEGVDRDEVECLIANMVYKNLMKGYISREKEKVVLSKAGAFPGTGL